MKIVIVGAGKVGTYIAADLLANHHHVVLVEQSIERIERRRTRGELDGVEWVRADACEATEIARAGLEDADVVAAVTGHDEDNLVISLLAKQEFGVPRVLARVNHPANEWLFNELWGVDVAVSTPHLLSALVEEAVSIGSLVRLLQFAGGRAKLVEVTLLEDSPALARPLAELAFPPEASVVAIVRSGDVVVPRGDTSMHAGDEVLVLVTDDAEPAVSRLLVGAP
jgi:trk system potassium uptake protein TrkA